ncbi:MAG: Cellulose-binding domain protein [Labilithrix sp.]|nr:Cellulose-binding domain protein [Labilithrix sp.]
MFGGGNLTTLFTAPHTFVNDRLAPLYGLDGVTGSELRKVDLDPTQRAGILTQLGFLSATSKANQTSPILRGKFVRTQLLCKTIPSPPMGVSVAVPDPKPGQTTRERFTELTASPSCQGCHSQLDPVGFGFEHYDGIGQWRADDEGRPVDAKGEVAGTAIGAFDGAVDLAKRLAADPDAQSCVSRQWFRYVAGRIESLEDKCTLQQLDASFKAANYSIEELLVAMTQTDGFLYRAVSP